MNEISQRLLIGLAALSLSLGAMAAELDYDYVEVRYVDAELDNVSADGDGILIGGSYSLTDEWLLVGSYRDLGFDFGIDASLLEVGAGYIVPTETAFDILGYARLVRSKAEAGGFEDSENGFSVSVGARGMINNDFEVRAFLNHIDVDDSDTFLEFAGDYYINRQFAVGASIELGGDADVFTIGGRFFFNQ
ncbi:MAG: outer membrane beta-barrel protein [Woeseiaceae bacterium]